MPSQRWCPTPEQLMILEEIYKGGIRTPKASHIHKITAHLSQYGKIEGKNVFYWFQNHKARDKQKLIRRQLFLAKQQQQQNYHHNSPPLLYYQPLFLAEQQNYHPLNSDCNLLPFLHQGTGGVEDASAIQLKPYNLKVDDPPGERCEEKSIKRMYGHDHQLMIMDVAPTSCSHRGPLKTLQLFPTTTTTTPMHKP